MWHSTQLTKLAGINYPIVQGPFGGGLSSIALTAIVSNAGGLGSFGCQPLSPQQIVKVAEDLRKVTTHPFNLNLWVSTRDESLKDFTAQKYRRLTEIFQPYFQELGLPVPERPQLPTFEFEDQVDAIFTARPRVFSFVFGIPSQDILEKCRSLNIITVGAATTPEEAVALEQAGVDAVVATGFEAGGHRVSFLMPAEESLFGTFSLIPQVADSVKIPVIAAGGIADARGIRAALALGADGVQIGTAFLATRQSNATKDHKDRIFSKEGKFTVLTKVFTGRWSRGLKNRLTEDLKNVQDLMAPYPLQGKFMEALKLYPATENTASDLKAYWAGQSAALLTYRDAEELLKALIIVMDKQYNNG